jgi:hypothetical protein
MGPGSLNGCTGRIGARHLRRCARPGPEYRPIERVALCLALILSGHLANGAVPASSAAAAQPEYQVKAAFLYQLMKFVEWPPNALRAGSETITIGVLGESPIAGALRSYEGTQIQGRRVVVKHFRALEDLEFSHVLFISASEKDRLEVILAAIKNAGTLTVGEVETFTSLGGIVGFLIVENRIAFEINRAAAEEARLKLSAQLLSLAKTVREKR